MSKILFLYPKDSTTDFLNFILENNLYSNEISIERPNTTIKEHQQSLENTKTSDSELVIFMGHGHNDSLHGANGSDLDIEFKAFRERFINKENIEELVGKKIISLSCNSNEKIGKIAIENGVRVFVGFGYIPTDWSVEAEGYPDITSDEIDQFRSLLVKVFSMSLNYSIIYQFTFFQFERIFKVITNKKIIELLNSDYDTNDWLLQSLYKLKDEIKVFGDGSIKITT
jgi:hypothetical protein